MVCGISFCLPDEQHPANGFRTKCAAISKAVSWHDA
jgi:hypothetical protein